MSCRMMKWNVVDVQEREDTRKKRKCEQLASRLRDMNLELFDEAKVEIPLLAEDSSTGIDAWESSLMQAMDIASSNLEIQRELDTSIRLLEEQIASIASELSDSKYRSIHRPTMTSVADLKNWKENLKIILSEVEFKKERDAVFLGRQAEKKLKLSNVNLSMKEQSRISDIQIARRMDKLNKLTKCISQIEDEQTRESFVLETNPLLDMERDDEFDDAIIEINTRVRMIKKAEQCRNAALEEAAKIAHLQVPDVPGIINAASKVSGQVELADIRQRVKKLINEEDKELDNLYIQDAISETLAGIGYKAEAGFENTEYGMVMMAAKESEPNYALRIQVNPTELHELNSNTLLTRVVSYGDTTPEQDKAVEENICADCDAMTRGLRDRGIEVDYVKKGKPGTHPLDKAGKYHTHQVPKSQNRRRGNTAARRRNA